VLDRASLLQKRKTRYPAACFLCPLPRERTAQAKPPGEGHYATPVVPRTPMLVPGRPLCWTEPHCSRSVNPVSGGLQVFCARNFVFAVNNVPTAVNLDDQLPLVAAKVCYVSADGELPAKLESAELSIFYPQPNPSFRLGRFSPHFSSAPKRK